MHIQMCSKVDPMMALNLFNMTSHEFQLNLIFYSSAKFMIHLDWIGLTGGYWCRHYSKDCSQAQTLPF